MLSPGVRLGRYEVLSPLGAGGMGEVYQARDRELDRRVALKVLPEDMASDPERLRLFEREARATAALSHPNVLTVFDVGREDGRAYLVFELLEGSTLGSRLAHGCLPVQEALNCAVQIARGLTAAHARGIVHRDLKPDNLFRATSGIVKILDFGLAHVQRSTEPNATASDFSGPGALRGTLGYMSPEQAKGFPGDARSDIFALGTVLYELLSGRHPFKRDSPAETLSAILRDEPSGLETLGEEVSQAVVELVRRCLEKEPENRFQTAKDLALALEAQAQAEAGGRRPVVDAATAEERPYPGLSAFTEADADQFFGREAEIGALWEKLQGRNLCAVIGPSGAGKSSFLRAGLIPRRPPGWRAAYLTPEAGPVGALARALTPELVNDAAAMADLMAGATAAAPETGEDRLLSALSRWSGRAGQALLVVDQFEELFTLNSKDVQERFGRLLGRMANEAGIRVLISLRDDFLFRCTEVPGLQAVFQDLTPLLALSAESLRRAVVEPAARLGVRFEDEALVREMVGTVEKERAALPLLAFAVARMWEERDRGRKLLTREAYERIGGVGGALAQHAEATLQRLAPAREGAVREIFRNLVTAHGTRAAREREELLSLFGGRAMARSEGARAEAELVLDALVDARLLTAYDRPREGGGSDRQVEIVHESLLQAWPRLVRWQSQDADGALFRDQLRQAAQLWRDRGQVDDLLWSGASFREFVVWKERYPGALSAPEEDYVRAMTARVARQRRRRRVAVGAVMAGLTIGLTLVAGLWVRSEQARAAARAESRQREAAQLLALGRLRLEDDPTAALAFALASLERADNDAARRFAVEALCLGPPARYISAPAAALRLAFSPDGRWIAGSYRAGTWLMSQDGAERREIAAGEQLVGWSGDGQLLVTREDGGRGHVFSVAGNEERRALDLGSSEAWGAFVHGSDLITYENRPPTARLRRIPLDGGEGVDIGHQDRRGLDDFENGGPWLKELRTGNLVVRPMDALASPPRTIGRHEGAVGIWSDRSGERMATVGARGDVWIWTASAGTGKPDRILRVPRSSTVPQTAGTSVRFDATGRSIVVTAPDERWLWDLSGPPDAEPTRLADRLGVAGGPVSASGDWVAAPKNDYVALWPLRFAQARILRRPVGSGLTALAFTPDGRYLVSHSEGGEIRLWPLGPEAGLANRVAGTAPLNGLTLDVDPSSHFVAAPAGAAGVALVPLDGGQPRLVKGNAIHWFARLDKEGRRLVAYTDANPNVANDSSTLHVWDLATGARTDLSTHQRQEGDCALGTAMEAMAWGLEFSRDGALLTDGFGGLRRWDLRSGQSRIVRPCDPRSFRGVLDAYHSFVLSEDERLGVQVRSWTDPMAPSIVTILDLVAGRDRAITRHGNRVSRAALDPRGRTLVTSDQQGLVRAGPVADEEPHLLYGHTAEVTGLTVSPDGKWIASASLDGTIRLWPMPSGRPLHALAYEALLAKLRSLTNLRVAADPAARDGYKLEIGPFPGWKVAPDWQAP